MTVRFRLMLSGAFALLGVISCLAYADSVRSEAQRVRADALERFGGEVTQLVVVNRTLETGDIVTESNVSLRDWVSDLAPAGAITKLDEVMGREVRVPVAEGAPLTDLNFRDEATLSEIPAGHVAVSVPVTDKLGIARGVTRGARLNAYVTSGEVAQLIATDIEVLSELGAGSGAAVAQQITIAVLPDDVTDVLGASAAGALRLVIPADDVGVSDESEKVTAPDELSLEVEGDEA